MRKRTQPALCSHKLYNPDYLPHTSSMLDPARSYSKLICLSGSKESRHEHEHLLGKHCLAIFTIFLSSIEVSHIDLNYALIKLQKFK